MELPALEQEQEIGEFDSLVLILKKQYRNKKVTPKQFEFNSQTKPWNIDHRVVHVILQCIPISVLQKIIPNGRVLISISVDKNITLKCLYKLLTEYLQDNLEVQGYSYMRSSSKMVLSDQNHESFMCKDPAIFEQIYQEPYSLVKMINTG